MSIAPKEPLPGPPVYASVFPTHALYVAEVLEMILDELVNDKRSINCLALTCKALAEPALDRLWALNDSLEPFIPLLPKELILADDSFFRFDHDVVSNLPPEKWAAFDGYARRARRLYAKTVTMNPHRVYSSIYKQLVGIRPNAELFPNLTTLAYYVGRVPDPHSRLFPSSLRCVTLSWARGSAPEIEAVVWTAVINQLLVDTPLLEQIHFEGSPKESLQTLTPISFARLQKISIKPSPLEPNVLHKYAYALSASPIQELDLRLVRWPDPRIQPISPVFPSLKKLTFDGPPTHVIGFLRLLSSPALRELAISSQGERGGDTLSQYAQLLTLLADKYRGVFRTLKIQHPLLCRDQANLESFLDAARTLADAGATTFQLTLIVAWKDLTQEVQDIIDPSRWTTLRHFRITSRRASASWSWTVQGNALFE